MALYFAGMKLLPLFRHVVIFTGLTYFATHATAQAERFRERDVFDPTQNSWSRVEQPARHLVLDRARQLLAEGAADEARDLLDDWLEANPDDPRYFEGMLLLGEAYFEKREFWPAVEAYERVAENSAGEIFFRAQRRILAVSRGFLAGEKRIVWGIFRFPAIDEALEFLLRIWERAPGTRDGEDALKLRADYYFENREPLAAQQAYALLAREYPEGRFVQFALLRSAEAAEQAYGGERYDDQPLLEADELYRQVIARYPTYARQEELALNLDGIRLKQAAKHLSIARWYARAGKPQAAAFYFRQTLKRWPDTFAAQDAAEGLRSLGFDVPADARVQLPPEDTGSR